MDESGSLENCRVRKGSGGSNPSPTADKKTSIAEVLFYFISIRTYSKVRIITSA